MSTQHTDINGQESPPPAPGSFYTDNTARRENLFPMENFPQPPRRPPRIKNGYLVAIVSVIVVAVVIFGVFAFVVAQQGQHSGIQVTPTLVPTDTMVVTPTPAEPTPPPVTGVINGLQACSASVASTTYWDRIIGTQGSNGKVESISCANVLGNPTLQALVTVRHNDANSTLNVYGFDKITSTNPTQLFKMSGLIKGNAKISYYNSIMTAEVDRYSTLNAGKPVTQWTVDLFREFTWNGESMSQVAFPGIFPDLTRYQAEVDQVQVNAGHAPWKNDPSMVAKALAGQFFGWQRTVMTKLLSGGGPQDVDATVQVQEAPVQGGQTQGPWAIVTLSRLEGNTHNMWVAIAVNDGTALTLTNIPARSLISSPVTLKGTGAAFEAVIGQAVIYDHLYTAIGHAQVTGDPGIGIANYSTKVSYTPSYHGVQEGIVVVYEANGGMSSENFTAVMVKVLISG